MFCKIRKWVFVILSVSVLTAQKASQFPKGSTVPEPPSEVLAWPPFAWEVYQFLDKGTPTWEELNNCLCVSVERYVHQAFTWLVNQKAILEKVLKNSEGSWRPEPIWRLFVTPRTQRIFIEETRGAYLRLADFAQVVGQRPDIVKQILDQDPRMVSYFTAFEKVTGDIARRSSVFQVVLANPEAWAIWVQSAVALRSTVRSEAAMEEVFRKPSAWEVLLAGSVAPAVLAEPASLWVWNGVTTFSDSVALMAQKPDLLIRHFEQPQTAKAWIENPFWMRWFKEQAQAWKLFKTHAGLKKVMNPFVDQVTLRQGEGWFHSYDKLGLNPRAAFDSSTKSAWMIPSIEEDFTFVGWEFPKPVWIYRVSLIGPVQIHPKWVQLQQLTPQGEWVVVTDPIFCPPVTQASCEFESFGAGFSRRWRLLIRECYKDATSGQCGISDLRFVGLETPQP